MSLFQYHAQAYFHQNSNCFLGIYNGWEGLIFKFSLLICLGWWHLLFPGLLTKNDFSLPPLSLWTFVHFHVKLVILFAFSMFTFFLFRHLHLAPRGGQTLRHLWPKGSSYALVHSAFWSETSLKYISFFMCAYIQFALSSNTSQKPNFVFNSGKSSIFFLLKTSRNLPLYFAPKPLMRSTPWAESWLSPFCSPSLCFRHYKIQFNTLQCVPMFIAMFQTHYKIVCNMLQCVAMCCYVHHDCVSDIARFNGGVRKCCRRREWSMTK